MQKFEKRKKNAWGENQIFFFEKKSSNQMKFYHSAMRQFFSSELPHAIPLEFAQGFATTLALFTKYTHFFRQSKVLPHVHKSET